MVRSSEGVLTKPIGIAIDFEQNTAYVRYRQGAIAKTVDVWLEQRVTADVDADDGVVGIQVWALDPITLANARHYAALHNLAFPSLKGCSDRS